MNTKKLEEILKKDLDLMKSLTEKDYMENGLYSLYEKERLFSKHTLSSFFLNELVFKNTNIKEMTILLDLLYKTLKPLEEGISIKSGKGELPAAVYILNEVLPFIKRKTLKCYFSRRIKNFKITLEILGNKENIRDTKDITNYLSLNLKKKDIIELLKEIDSDSLNLSCVKNFLFFYYLSRDDFFFETSMDKVKKEILKESLMVKKEKNEYSNDYCQLLYFLDLNSIDEIQDNKEVSLLTRKPSENDFFYNFAFKFFKELGYHFNKKNKKEIGKNKIIKTIINNTINSLTRIDNLKKLKEQNRADDYLKINVFMNSNVSINKLEDAMKEIKNNKHFLNKKNEITEECADYLELYYGA